MEKYSLEQADRIISVTKILSAIFSKKSGKDVLTVYNGFNYSKNINQVNQRNEIKQFIYAGNLNCGREESFKYFLNNISKKEDILVKLYCSNSDRIKNRYKKYIEKKILIVKDRISHENLMEIIPEHSYGLHFNSKEAPGALSTKIYDYLSVNVPVLSVNFGGEIEELLETNSFGYSINIDKNNFDQNINNILTRNYIVNRNNVMKFDYKNIVKQLIEIINIK